MVKKYTQEPSYLDTGDGKCGEVQAGILTVEGCLGDEGQESESGELCLGAGALSYQQEAQDTEFLRKSYGNYRSTTAVMSATGRKD